MFHFQMSRRVEESLALDELFNPPNLYHLAKSTDAHCGEMAQLFEGTPARSCITIVRTRFGRGISRGGLPFSYPVQSRDWHSKILREAEERIDSV